MQLAGVSLLVTFGWEENEINGRKLVIEQFCLRMKFSIKISEAIFNWILKIGLSHYANPNKSS